MAFEFFWRGKKCKTPSMIQTYDLQIRNKLKPTALRCYVTLLRMKLLILLHFILLFILINNTSNYGGVPYHLKPEAARRINIVSTQKKSAVIPNVFQ